MKNIHFLFAVLVFGTIFQSCQKESIEETITREAPALPSMQSFVMPLDGFENTDSLPANDGTVDSRTITAKTNFAFAGLNVLVWNSVLTATMAIPVASFAEAFNHEGVLVGTNTFEWRYNFRALGKIHTATLTAEVLNADEDVAWTMTISQRNGFQDFVYYTGLTNRNGTAKWTLNHQPNNPESLLEIEYAKTSDEEFEIRYTNIRPAHSDTGDYIEFQAKSTGDLNRAYDIFDATDDNFIEIRWNAPNGNGQVKNFKFFGDDEWHCWDTDKEDTDC